LPPLNVYVDSPMETAATAITLRHLDIADADTVSAMRWSREHHQRPRIRFVESQRESRTLSEVEHGALIIAASGMCDAGRVRQHLLTNLPNASCSVVFTGFQAAGTLGRQIVDGSTTVSIDGVAVPVRADIYTIGGLSAHADRDALLEWLAHFSRAPEHTFVVHGEAAVALSFAEAVRGRFGWQVKVPTTKQCFTI
jgi:metallo-beta-lactamase family protein